VLTAASGTAGGVGGLAMAGEHSGSPARVGGGARICLCIDDLGLHEAITQAALALVAAGRVHALGGLVGAPAWPSAAAALRGLSPAEVDVGLHFDLTEAPLNARLRRPLLRWIAASLLGRIDRAALRREVHAQLDAFEQAMGRPPAFVDGHQHVHQLPGVRDVLLNALAQRARLPAPWLRCGRPAPRPRGALEAGWGHRLKPLVIGGLGAEGLALRAHRQGLQTNRRLLGVYDFQGGAARYQRCLSDWLAVAAEGDLLMCHPACSPIPGEVLGAARQAEFEVLAGDALPLALAAARLCLRPMSRILADADADADADAGMAIRR
jgi:hypothetical protein